MKHKQFWSGAASAALVVAALGLAQATEEPGQAAEPGQTSGEPGQVSGEPGLTLPWSRMTSLDAGQRREIDRIHAEAVAKIRAVREQERADIVALLSEAQQAELDEVTAAIRQERNERARQRRAERRATEEAEAPEDMGN